MSSHIANLRPPPDQVMVDIADYVLNYKVASELAYTTARNCLIDTLGGGLEALEYPECTKILGPVVHGTLVPNGARVPGTQFQLDPVQAAFNIGAMIRWLDFNDTWLTAEWGHPSDNLGGILATADWLSRDAIAAGQRVVDAQGHSGEARERRGCSGGWNARTVHGNHPQGDRPLEEARRRRSHQSGVNLRAHWRTMDVTSKYGRK
jgi:hypothetical protein